MEPAKAKTGYATEAPQVGNDETIIQMGYTQELSKRFGFVSMLAMSSTIMVTWEGLLVVYSYGLYDGGPLGSIIGFLFAWVGYTLVVLSFAEMCSMYPTAGGQYHWATELAPERWRRPLSYITGWLLFLAWQADLASVAYLVGTLIQSLIALNHPEYDGQGWQGTLLLYAVVLIAAAFNTLLIRFLPFAEGIILSIHILGWFAVLISIIVMGSHASNADVWGSFLNLGGYSSSGLSYFVGLTGPAFAFLGADGASHMCEEVRNPRTMVPWTLVSSITINGILGFGMVIAMTYCQGNIEQILNTDTGFPFVQAFLQALRSVPWATGFVAMFVVLLIFAGVAVFTATSRVTYAFARDGALPGSIYLGHLDERTNLPLWSCALSVAITMLLGLINIGSSTAFNAVISLTIGAYYSSYFMAIMLLIVRKLSGTAPQPGPWQMGKFTGILVNITALIYIVIVFIFSFFPITVPVTLNSINWAVVLYFGAVVIGILSYLLRRKHFREPKLHYRD